MTTTLPKSSSETINTGSEHPTAIRTFCDVMAFLGLLFFAALLLVKACGGAIYATTSKAVVREVDPIWEETTRKAVQDKGSHFSMKIGGE